MKLSQKYPFYLSVLTALYFIMYTAVNMYKIQHVLIGVFAEILTIPAILAAPLLMMYSIYKYSTQRHKNIHTIGTIIVSAIVTIYIVFRFIYG